MLHQLSKKKVFTLFLFITVFLSSSFQITVANDMNQSEYSFSVAVWDNEPNVFESNGEFHGIFIDLLKYIAAEENWELEFIKESWNKSFYDVLSNKIDIIPAIAYTDERIDLFQFNNQTVISNWGTVIAKKNLKIKLFFDLEGLRVGILPNDIYYSYHKGILETLQKLDVNCTFYEYTDYPEIVRAIQENKIDAGVVNRIFFHTYKHKEKVKETFLIINPVELRYATSLNNTNRAYLTERIDYHLQKLKDDSESLYYDILDKYLVSELQIIPTWALILIISFSSISFISLVLMFVFRYSIIKEKIETMILKRKNRKLASILIHSTNHLDKLLNKLREQLQTSIRNIEDIKIEDPEITQQINKMKLVLEKLNEILFSKT